MANASSPGIDGYLLDNYGICTRDADCQCLKPSRLWLGRGCPNWRPLGATNFDQLKEAQEVCRGAIEGRRDSANLP